MPRARLAASSLTIAALALAAGCGGSDDAKTKATTTTAPKGTTTSTTPTTTSTTTTTVAATTTTAPTGPTNPDLVPDGGSFAYVKGVSVAGSTITVDIAELMYGDAAVKAAIADGAIPAGSTSIDNDYYIRNKNPKLRTANVQAGAPIRVLDEMSSGLVPGDMQKLADHLAARTAPDDAGVPVQITAAAGVVTRIDEVFFP